MREACWRLLDQSNPRIKGSSSGDESQNEYCRDCSEISKRDKKGVFPTSSICSEGAKEKEGKKYMMFVVTTRIELATLALSLRY